MLKTIENSPLPEECDKEINDAHATANKNQEEYDKQLLTLSAGFLALILAFIKNVVPLKEALYLWTLNLSIVFIGLCVLLVLTSFQVSNFGHFKAQDYWRGKRQGKQKPEFPYGYATAVKWMNVVSGMLFGLGLILIVVFVILNLNSESHMSDKNTQNANLVTAEGQFMKTPSAVITTERGANIKLPSSPPPAEKPKENSKDNQPNNKK